MPITSLTVVSLAIQMLLYREAGIITVSYTRINTPGLLHSRNFLSRHGLHLIISESLSSSEILITVVFPSSMVTSMVRKNMFLFTCFSLNLLSSPMITWLAAVVLLILTVYTQHQTEGSLRKHGYILILRFV